MKKIKRYAGVLALLAVATLVLSACGATTDPHVAPHSGIYGWVYQWLGRPLQNIMIQTAHMIGGDNGAGWGIVIITVVVRCTSTGKNGSSATANEVDSKCNETQGDHP